MSQHAVRTASSASANPRAHETRERIVAAFRDLVAAGEPSALKPANIAHAAGVSRSSFYAHFADLADLASAALRDDLADLLARDVAARRNGRPDDEDVARRSLFALVERLGRYTPVFQALPLSVPGKDPATLVTRELEHTVRSAVRARRRDVSETRVAIAASVLTGGILAGYARAHAEPSEENRAVLVDELMKWLPEWMIHPEGPTPETGIST